MLIKIKRITRPVVLRIAIEQDVPDQQLPKLCMLGFSNI